MALNRKLLLRIRSSCFPFYFSLKRFSTSQERKKKLQPTSPTFNLFRTLCACPHSFSSSSPHFKSFQNHFLGIIEHLQAIHAYFLGTPWACDLDNFELPSQHFDNLPVFEKNFYPPWPPALPATRPLPAPAPRCPASSGGRAARKRTCSPPAGGCTQAGSGFA
jgi:hypothetical protein